MAAIVAAFGLDERTVYNWQVGVVREPPLHWGALSTRARAFGAATPRPGSGDGTFRSRISALVRRGRALVRQRGTLEQAMFLVGTVSNFCDPHTSLRRVLYLPDNSRRWVPMTPAMQAGITEHLWTVEALLGYQVPLPRWEPPKRCGRRSKQLQALMDRWLK